MRAIIPCLIAALCLIVSACGDEYPEDKAGRRISGRVFYDGDIEDSTGQPAIGVFVYATPPLDMGIPNGAQFFDVRGPVPPEGLAYELQGLDPYEYTIFAAVVDLDDPNKTPTTLGAWPDVCSLMVDPVKVEVTEDAPLTDMDITLYDNLGFDDPCFSGE